jgi:hypothetical protein
MYLRVHLNYSIRPFRPRLVQDLRDSSGCGGSRQEKLAASEDATLSHLRCGFDFRLLVKMTFGDLSGGARAKVTPETRWRTEPRCREPACPHLRHYGRVRHYALGHCVSLLSSDSRIRGYEQ